MSDDFPFRSLSELARMLAHGETSSRAIVEACLARIDALDHHLHAFIDVYRDDALASADTADRERRSNAARGPLAGLPIALKDLFHIEGRQTTAGSKSWRGRISDHTATAVERLRSAGMIPLGKTHMVEFAFGGWGRNQPMGAPWNPWDDAVHRVAGGSSSGSAVAVAGGLCPAAIGSDTGGSIRIPAALCGITGLKPTYGRVSLYGAVPLSGTLDSIGPLARTVEDAALLTAAMSGPDPRDPATQSAPRGDLEAALAGTADIRGVRITALAPEAFPAYTLPDVIRAYQAAIGTLRELGARVDEAPFPLDFEDMMVRNGRIIAAEAYALHRAYIEDPSLDIDPWVRQRVLGGKAVSTADYIDLLALRAARHRRIRGLDARPRCAADPDTADHRHATRRRRRSDDAARDVDPNGQLSRRLRAVAAGRVLGGRIAHRRAGDRRGVRRCDTGADRTGVSARDRLAYAPAGVMRSVVRRAEIPRSTDTARPCRS